jgi:hypothetical protein
MRKIFISLMLCGLLIILGSSCKTIGGATSIPTVAPETSFNWWALWLAQPACKAPCWHNITPGVTTLKEAVSIVGNSPEIKIKYQVSDGIDWTFKQNKDGDGTINASEDGIVRVMWIENISDKKLLLEMIIASYNDPQYVYPYDCREGMCTIDLVYPDMGMFLSIFIENKGVSHDVPQFEIRSDTVVNRIYFIEPGIEKFQNSFGSEQPALLMPWKGYSKYP